MGPIMPLTFRQVSEQEAETYQALILAAYAPTKALGIHFDAASTTREKTVQHLREHGVYGLYDGDLMVASVTLRYPWGPLPGPLGCPISAGLPHTLTFPADSTVSKFFNDWNKTS